METRRDRYKKRHEALKQARASWDPHVRDIAEQIIPYRIVKDIEQRNRGDRKDYRLYNNTPTRAALNLAAALMAGMTSPARQWFHLEPSDPELEDSKNVRVYLDTIERRIMGMFARSSFYKALSNGTYLDAPCLGTGFTFVEQGEPGTLHYDPRPWGEYCLDTNDRGEVDVCFRELPMTVRQMAQKWGLDKLSRKAKEAYRLGNYSDEFIIVHAVQPNDEYEAGIIGRHGMPFASCWWERDEKESVFLEESGYRMFPGMAPRWFVRPGDAYGRGPGWDARGDCKALQFKEKQLAKMLDKTTDPPMLVVGNLDRASLLPAAFNVIDGGDKADAKPLITIAPGSIAEIREHIARDEDRISRAFFNDLLRHLIDDERNQRATATEIEGVRQEVMLRMGPVLENFDRDLFEPAVMRAYDYLEQANLLPPEEEIPEELRGQEVKVKFTSIMHQMQQSTELGGLRTFVNDTVALAAAKPEALDKINTDAVIDKLARITGVDAKVVNDSDEVKKLRDARAQAEQVKQQGEAMLAATQGASNLSGVEPGKLAEIAQAISPAAAAQGGALSPYRGAA